MVQALIRMNGVSGSNPPNGTPLVLGASVVLTNLGTGGELTYLWELLDKPEGSLSSIASASSANTSFTPDVEGTYLVKLSVNRTLPTERTDTQIASVAQIRTGQRIPAAGETIQSDSVRGWALAVNRLLKLVDSMRADPGIFVASVQETITRGQVAYVSELTTLNSGLPEEALIASMKKARANTYSEINGPLYIAESDVGGGSSIGTTELGKFRSKGVFGPLSGSPTLGDPVYLSDAAGVSLTAGTIACQVGKVCHVSGGNYYILFDGVGAGSSISSAPVLVDGSFAGLPSAKNIRAILSGLTFQAGEDSCPVRIQQFIDPSTVADVFRILDFDELAVITVNNLLDIVFDTKGNIYKGGGHLGIGTTTAHDVQLQVNGVVAWTLGADGKLSSTGADRLIAGLGAPTDPKHATRKSYVDAQVPILHFGNTVSALVEHALDPGFGARTAPAVSGSFPSLRAPRAGTLSNLYLRLETQPVGANIDYVVYVNGGATTLTVTTSNGGGSQELQDTTHTVAVAAGDRITVHGKPAGVVSTGAVDVIASVRFAGA